MEFVDFDFDSTEPFVLANYLFGRDFLIVDHDWPSDEFWDSYPFESQGVEFRRSPLEAPGWPAFKRHLADLKYFGLLTPEGSPQPDLAFLTSATKLGGLAAAGSRAAVDVSHLPLTHFHGEGANLVGLFDLPTLADVFLTDRMPSLPVTSPLSEVIIRHLPESTDLDRLRAPVNLLDLRVLSGRIDLGALTRFINLESLTLVDMTHIAGIESLTELPRLRNLMLSDCTEIENLDAFDHLVNLTITIAGENVFDKERRRRLTAANRSRWEFSSVMGSSDGSQMYLVHPGIKKAMTAADGDIDAGPGAEVTSAWEQLSRTRQADRVSRFAEAFKEHLIQRGATTVTNLAAGESTPLSGFDTRPFTSDEVAAFLSFTDSAGIELGRVNENFWLGALLRASRPPKISRFR